MNRLKPALRHVWVKSGTFAPIMLKKTPTTPLRKTWLPALFLCLASVAMAQKGAELKKSGEKAFANRRWADALTLLSQYQQEKPGDASVLTKLGIVHYHLHQPEKARQFLEYVAKQNPASQDADLFLYLARTLHGQQEFEKAIPAYKSFLRVAGERHPQRAGTPDNIRRCVNAQSIPANDNVALVENLGDHVNTPGDEFAPLTSPNSPNRLYFSAAREGATGGRRNDAGLEDLESGHWCSDMFFTNQATSGWEHATSLSGLLNTPRHEIALSFGSKGQVLYFFRGFTPYSGDFFADTAGRKDEYAVNPPVFVSTIMPENGDRSPFFFNDTTVLFSSRQPGGQGGFDLYITTYSAGRWTLPQNLGPEINSPYDETAPFLARDGRTLYFSSNRLESMGGLDIFRSIFSDETQTWPAPANLGFPVNSPGDDEYFRLAADGRSGFFSSDRLEGLGERDLYIVYFREEQQEQARASQPALFTEVQQLAANNRKNQSEAGPASIPALLYNTDKDVLIPENLKIAEDAATLARSYPQATVLVTCFTDETGPAKFDLYYGIKRAEMVGKTLTERGVPAGRIVLRSAGSTYPLARTIIDATVNPAAARLNRRIEISLVTQAEKLPVEVRVQRPEVSELMAASGIKNFDQNTTGVFFKVEIATTRQILTNDALAMFSDLMIESQPGSGAYRYTAGLFRQFDEAAQLKKELQNQGFPEAAVVAYIDGIRITKAEAVGLLKKHPELAGFIRG